MFLFLIKNILTLSALLSMFEKARITSAPVAPVEAISSVRTTVVIFPIKIDNVFQCGTDLLRKIEQYCVWHFDIHVNSTQVGAYENIINQMIRNDAILEKRERKSGGSESQSTLSKWRQHHLKRFLGKTK